MSVQNMAAGRVYELEIRDAITGRIIRRQVPEGATIQPPIPPGTYEYRARLVGKGTDEGAWSEWAEFGVPSRQAGKAVVVDPPQEPLPSFDDLRRWAEEVTR